MIAFDGSIVIRAGVEIMAASPVFRGLPVHLLMSRKKSRDAPGQLRCAKATLETTGFEVTASLLHGDAESIIALAVREQADQRRA